MPKSVIFGVLGLVTIIWVPVIPGVFIAPIFGGLFGYYLVEDLSK
jgi:hypothetical protein